MRHTDHSTSTTTIDNKKKLFLHNAIEQKNIEVVKWLLQEGVDVTEKDDYGNTPLHIACYSQSLPIVELLLNKNLGNVDQKNNDGNTPLTYAAAEGIYNIKILSLLLLKHGPNINVPGEGKCSLLYSAAEDWNTEAILFLLKHGANVEQKNQDGNTPLMAALNNAEDVDFSDPTDFELLKSFLMEKPQLANEGNDMKSTPLHHAVQNKRHVNVIALLLNLKAAINAIDNNGLTPFDYAIKNKLADITELLYNHGAKLARELKKQHPDCNNIVTPETTTKEKNKRPYTDTASTIMTIPAQDPDQDYLKPSENTPETKRLRLNKETTKKITQEKEPQTKRTPLIFCSQRQAPSKNKQLQTENKELKNPFSY